MEEHDNPFRPEGSLSTEVEPIVEGFKTKPYATTATASMSPPVSPVPPPAPIAALRASRMPQQQAVPLLPSLVHVAPKLDDNDVGARKTEDDGVIRKISPPAIIIKNGKNGGKSPTKHDNSIGDSVVDGNTPHNAVMMVVSLDNGRDQEVEHKLIQQPPSGSSAATYAELVHLDNATDEAQKRRRCCASCCCVQ